MTGQRKRIPGVYWLVGLVSVSLVAAAAFGAYWLLRQRSRLPGGGQAIPLSTGGGAGVVAGGAPAVEVSGAMQDGQSTTFIRLSEGQPQPQQVEALPLAQGEPLSPEEIDAILGRLPELPVEAQDQADFRLAQEPIPPPRPGQTIPESFPPPPEALTPEPAPSGPLEVLRYAPQGEIDAAPFIAVTFNQPMAPLDTLEALSAQGVPVQIEPALPGTWRWVGTRTLNFLYASDSIDRLPKATDYRVTIPAGTRSQTGGVLAETVTWTFSTPPVKVLTEHPTGEAQPLQPLIFIAFDQRIEPANVLEVVQVQANGSPVGVQLASAEQVQADKQVSILAEQAGEGRWMALSVLQPLPTDAQVTVIVGPGTPSAEGPRRSESAHSFSFRTYAPLRIEEHGCEWYTTDCQPLTPFFIRFNNPIDAAAYKEEMLRIEPQAPGVMVDIIDATIRIRGATSAQTTYTVLVSKDLQDIFGQTLGKDQTLTFKVGPAEPTLIGPEKMFLTLDPAAAKPAFTVHVINYNQLEVQVNAVQPADWPAFKSYLEQYQQGIAGASLPGRRVRDETMRLETPSDQLSEVSIDLSRHMDGSSGQFIVMVRPPRGLLQRQEEIRWRTVHAWVQITPLGLDAFVDSSQMVVWATSLKDGAPLEGVSVSLGEGGSQAITGSDGLARLSQTSGASYLVARRGADVAMLPNSPYPWDDPAWSSYTASDQLRWFVFDDRHIYRPGEEVHLKGWLRRVTAGPQGDVKPFSAAGGLINYTIYEAQGNQIGQGQAPIAGLGGFDFSFTIPEAVNLGNAWINLEAVNLPEWGENWQYTHNFQVLEFRRPEFEVTARNETPGPFFAGESGVVAVSAQYYAGGALPNAEVTWNVYSSPSQYQPPNWPDFTFGKWTPWWWGWRGGYAEFGGPGYGVETVETFSGSTDAAGEHYLRLDFDIRPEPEPVSVRAEATVMDVNRQAWSSATNLLVHPASLYVGLRSPRYFVQRGDPLKVEVIVTDLDGNPVADRPVEVQAARLDWQVVAGEWREIEVDPQTCSLGSTLEPLSCSFETALGGSYRIRARVTDDKGRANQTTITRWVSGGQLPPRRSVEQEEATLIPDQESYQPGDVAQILVQSPFSPAHGLLTVSRSGMLYTQAFELVDGSATLEIPITDAHIPNLNVQVDLVGSAPRTDDVGEALPGVEPRPAYASGALNLKIPPHQRALTLQLLPEASELEPGGETNLNVRVTGADGSPQPGVELAVVVVDEAVLALSSYSMADPLNVFYAERSPDVNSYYSRAYIQLIDPNKLLDTARHAVEVVKTVEVQILAAAPREMPAAMATGTPAMAEADMGMAQAEPIRLRSDFNPLAAFVPAASTGADGFASIPVRLPDNLTRYRVMVVAVDANNRFGSGETNLTARLPLMVRPSAPRFLNFGDRFELPVVLQNQTDQPMEVSVVARASNLALAGADGSSSLAGQRVTVPARDRIEVRFPAETQLAGTARLQIAAVSGSFADAATIELPVYTPATSEAFAVYGVVDEGAVAQPIASPQGVFPQYGGLEVSTSSTAMQALTDAVIYLTSYPFDCTEQIASRLLALAALKDVLAAFDASQLPSPEAIQAAVTRDIEHLRRLQNDDGGFPYWARGFDSIPFNSIHVAYALQRAQEMDFAVPAEMRQRLLEHIRNIESYYPSYYSAETRRTLSAYALFVRMKMGDRDAAKALRLLAEAPLESFSLDAIGWLWQVIQDEPQATATLEEIRRLVNNRVVETPGAANFTTQYTDQSYLLLSSDRRTDAILLEALMTDQPQSDLIPKLVNGLMAHRKRGRWNNTQENVFILLSLERYFKTYEAQTPDFVARIWLGEAYAGEHAYSGRTTERRETVVPMAYLVDAIPAGSAQNLILSKEGAGRLYYRLGLRYAPTDLQQEPLDMGFVVQRVYEAVDDPGDVYQDAQGAWHIKAGARVRVRLTLVADNRRYHVALADPLPAGLEILNPALAVTGSLPQDPQQSRSYHGWWWWSWFEHQNLRDERAEAFTSLLWEGVYEYTYDARATTPGVFVAPPAKAEEMYSPEVFGRSASAVVIVE